MKLVKFFRLFVFILFFALFLYIVLLNSIPVKFAFYKLSCTVPLYVVIFVSFFLGWLLAYLYSLIGSVKNKYKIMSLNKKVSSLEEQVKDITTKESVKLYTKEESIGTNESGLSQSENDKNSSADSIDETNQN